MTSEFYVYARLIPVDGRRLASAETTDGPSIGTGETPDDAPSEALQPVRLHGGTSCSPACRLG